MDHDWSLKRLHRQIVTSATYRQSSKVTPEAYEKDPYNRLLARGSRFRVEGEIVRDITLAASGLLNPKLGGPSVMPPAPAFLFEPPTSYAPFPWKHETGPDKYRRALYTFRRRSTPYPALQTFDVPNGDSACVRRQRSNSPLAGTGFAERTALRGMLSGARPQNSHGRRQDGSRNESATHSAARWPVLHSRMKHRSLIALLNKERQRIADGWVSAAEIATGTNAIPKDLPPGVTSHPAGRLHPGFAGAVEPRRDDYEGMIL